jgi:hypothetical protein
LPQDNAPRSLTSTARPSAFSRTNERIRITIPVRRGQRPFGGAVGILLAEDGKRLRSLCSGLYQRLIAGTGLNITEDNKGSATPVALNHIGTSPSDWFP